MEETTVEIIEEDVEEVGQKGEFCLIGKIWVDKNIGKSIIESAMGKIWRISAKAVL